MLDSGSEDSIEGDEDVHYIIYSVLTILQLFDVFWLVWFLWNIVRKTNWYAIWLHISMQLEIV